MQNPLVIAFPVFMPIRVLNVSCLLAVALLQSCYSTMKSPVEIVARPYRNAPVPFRYELMVAFTKSGVQPNVHVDFPIPHAYAYEGYYWIYTNTLEGRVDATDLGISSAKIGHAPPVLIQQVKGHLDFTGDKVTIDLQLPYFKDWQVDSWQPFPFNGTYDLRVSSEVATP